MPLDEAEKLDEAALGRLVDAKLMRLVEKVRGASPFWAARLGTGAFTGRVDLETFPILKKDEWVAASPPRSNAALTGKLTDAYIFRSGGTSGDPKFSVYAREEYAALIPFFKRSYGAVGLEPGDRVANLFAAGGLYASFVFVNRMVEELGCLNFPYTAAAAPEAVADGVARFGINVLLGFPSWLMQVAPAIAAQNVQVEKVFYAGEHLHPDDRARLFDWLGGPLIASAGYGAVDSGLMGYQCPESADGVHHALADHSHLEILDPEIAAPVTTDQMGLLVVTALDRLLHPVIRYQIGDLARWVPGACPCGRTLPRFELLGRGDDAIRLAYAAVTRNEVLAAIADVPGVGSAVQLVKRRVGEREAMLVRIEVEVGHALDADALVARVLAAKPDVAKIAAAGTIAPLEVELLPPGGIPRVAVTGKFRGTVDESGPG